MKKKGKHQKFWEELEAHRKKLQNAAQKHAEVARGHSTGYFGVPGHIARGKVHIINNGMLDLKDRTVCGTVFSQLHEFQFCAAGVYLDYVDCKKCRAWYARKIMDDQ